MTATDTGTETTPVTAEASTTTPPATASRARGLALLGAGDHKVVGRLFIGTSVLFLLLAGVTGILVSAERIDTSGLQVLKNSFGQVFTLHSISAVFLFLIPFLLGLAISIVPLQVGASTVAFPRAATAAYWTWLISGGILIAAYGINGGPFGGDANGVDLSLVALAGVIIALLLATICVLTTVLALRTTGMWLDRVPLFSWSMVVAGTIWLLSLPVLLAVIVLMYLGQHNGVAGWNDPNGIYNRMVWAFQQPQLYAFAIPALGIIGDTVPVFARARLRNRGVWMIAIGAFGMLGFGAWAQPWLSPRVTREFLYIAVAFLVFVPLLVVAGGVADTLRRGRATLASPVLFSLTALLALLAGAAAGAVSSIHALDLLGTTWTSAQAHLVLLGTAAAGIGAIHYWSPKLFGRVLGEGLGRATAGLLLLGTATLIIPDLVAGGLDQCRAVAQYAVKGGCPPVRDGVESLNFVSLVGGAVVTLAVLVFVVNLVTSLASRSNEPVPDDPWDGQTLEWSTTSPPPLGNFPEAPVVTSAEPLLDRAEEVEA